jgi:hypothetical protein
MGVGVRRNGYDSTTCCHGCGSGGDEVHGRPRGLGTDDADVPVFHLHLYPTNPERRSGAGMRTAGTACSLE